MRCVRHAALAAAILALLPGSVERVAARIDTARLSRYLLFAAASDRGAGPVFLGVPDRLGLKTPEHVPSSRLAAGRSASYLSVLVRQASGRGTGDVHVLRALVAAGFRHEYSSALLALRLAQAGQTEEAAAVFDRCPAARCEVLLVRASTPRTCGVADSLSRGTRVSAYCLALSLRRDGRLDEAMAQFERALAATAVRAGRQDGAAVVDAAPSPSDVLYRMGEIELTRGNLPRAWQRTRESLQGAPRHYWAWFQRAILLAREGRRQAAISELEALLGEYPAHGAAMLNLGQLEELEGHATAAERWYLRAADTLPDKAPAEKSLRRLRRGAGGESR